MKNILLIIGLMIGTTIFAQEVPKLKQQNGKYALVDKNNKVISDWYSAIYDFEYGIAIVRDYTKFGAINKKGEIVIPVQYTATEVQTKFAEYLERSNPYDIGVLIYLGDNFLGKDQEKALEFYNKAISLAPDSTDLYVKIGDKLLGADQEKALEFYNKANQIKPKTVNLKEKFDFIKSGIAAIKNKDGKYGVIDTTWKLLTKQWYDRAWANERNIVIALKKDGKWTMINNKGEFLKGWYYGIYIFSEGLAFVKKEENGKWGVINEKGDLVIDYQFDDVKEIFKDGKAKVEKDGETFWINRKGKRIEGE